MRRFFLVLALLVVAFSNTAFAHPPQDISISFDSQTKILSATITHITNNPLSHFIKKVDIAVNGKEILEHTLSSQDNNNAQAVTYRIPDVKAGDAITVEAYCSISGVLEKEIKVE